MPGIVVGTDGSRHSQRALEWAMREAGVRHVPLTVVTVYQVNAGFWGGRNSEQDDAGKRARARASEQADRAARQVGGDKPSSVRVQAVCGVPADELMKAACGADMLVVAARGAGGFVRLRLGSVSTQLAHQACCPLVIIPPDEAYR